MSCWAPKKRGLMKAKPTRGIISFVQLLLIEGLNKGNMADPWICCGFLLIHQVLVHDVALVPKCGIKEKTKICFLSKKKKENSQGTPTKANFLKKQDCNC